MGIHEVVDSDHCVRSGISVYFGIIPAVFGDREQVIGAYVDPDALHRPEPWDGIAEREVLAAQVRAIFNHIIGDRQTSALEAADILIAGIGRRPAVHHAFQQIALAKRIFER